MTDVIKAINENDPKITFEEYEDFLWQNSHLTRAQLRPFSRICWNKGLTKYEALKSIENA